MLMLLLASSWCFLSYNEAGAYWNLICQVTDLSAAGRSQLSQLCKGSRGSQEATSSNYPTFGKIYRGATCIFGKKKTGGVAMVFAMKIGVKV